ncbi:major facilitator superfamily domain-containing protein [Gongronella butleri]|nr:major facilitator superfamily domain-containing protein [Gongronella butleri]
MEEKPDMNRIESDETIYRPDDELSEKDLIPGTSKVSQSTIDNEKGACTSIRAIATAPSSAASQHTATSRFTHRQKIMITIIASIASFFSPFSANCYFPAMQLIETDLQIDSNRMYATITVYMVFQGIAPSMWSYWADHRGRRPVYLYTLCLYILSNVGLALASNYIMLLGFRILQAFGASSIISIGAGTIADITSPEERGGYQGWYSLGFTLAPAIAPAVGGLISKYLGWRWIFWSLAVTCAVHWIVLFFALPETLMLGCKAKALSPTSASSWGDWWCGWSSQKHRTSIDSRASSNASTSPMTCAKYKDVLALAMFGAFQYAALYTVITLLPAIFRDGYNLDTWAIGLTYLAMGFGFIVGSILQGYILNQDYRHFGMGPDPEVEYARLRWVWLHAVLFNAILATYGWSAVWQYHIAVLLVSQFLLGVTSQAMFNALQTLLIDLFPMQSASIQACNTIFRCFFGAIATGVIDPMVVHFGYGWSYTMISCLLLASRAFLVVELKYGAKWRKERELEQGQVDDTLRVARGACRV